MPRQEQQKSKQSGASRKQRTAGRLAKQSSNQSGRSSSNHQVLKQQKPTQSFRHTDLPSTTKWEHAKGEDSAAKCKLTGICITVVKKTRDPAELTIVLNGETAVFPITASTATWNLNAADVNSFEKISVEKTLTLDFHYSVTVWSERC